MTLVRLLLALGIVVTSLFNRAGRLTLLYNTKGQVQHWTNIKTRNMPLTHLPFPDDIELKTAVFEYINKVCFYVRHVHVVPTVCPNVQLGGVFDIGNWLPGCAQGVLVLSITRTSPAILPLHFKEKGSKLYAYYAWTTYANY
ncbi:hypothetical protein F4806DRAFT_180625 [Annulohypoxylon nitens]|nr:hypothetical protein F4806DRAFT_180625 [Annulohypoxylon nitens]